METDKKMMKIKIQFAFCVHFGAINHVLSDTVNNIVALLY